MKTTSLTAFASQLRAWRQQMGWTQVEAADKLGYSASLVSGIETMDKTPTADFAQHCDTIFQTPGTFATMRDLVAREVWLPRRESVHLIQQIRSELADA